MTCCQLNSDNMVIHTLAMINKCNIALFCENIILTLATMLSNSVSWKHFVDTSVAHGKKCFDSFSSFSIVATVAFCVLCRLMHIHGCAASA